MLASGKIACFCSHIARDISTGPLTVIDKQPAKGRKTEINYGPEYTSVHRSDRYSCRCPAYRLTTADIASQLHSLPNGRQVPAKHARGLTS